MMLDPDYRHHVQPHLRAAIDRLRDPQAVWDIFRDDQTIAEMEHLTALKRPALGATSQRLLALGDWVHGKDARQTFGKITRCIMESIGYTVEKRDIETPEDPLFTRGTRYRLRELQSVRAPNTTLIICNLDSDLLARLQLRAANNGRSAEAEAAHILTDVLTPQRQPGPNLAEAIHRRFASLGGVDDLEPHPPVLAGEPPKFEP
jgi:antitoxin FitA